MKTCAFSKVPKASNIRRSCKYRVSSLLTKWICLLNRYSTRNKAQAMATTHYKL